jgi:hypothetical protein
MALDIRAICILTLALWEPVVASPPSNAAAPDGKWSSASLHAPRLWRKAHRDGRQS